MTEQELLTDTQQRNSSNEVQSEKELKLIQELVSLRKESDRSLEYEQLDDYRMPPRTHFAMLKKPAVSIKYGRMTFNMAAIRLFEGTVNILPMIHEGKFRLAAVPCTEEENASVEWARKNKQGKWTNKEIRSEEFIGSIFKMMGWDPKCRYKVLGEVRNSDRGLILVFDMTECICYEKGKEAYTNPATGEVKQRQIKRYLDESNNHIGKPYNDYEAERKLNQFENTGGYSDGSEDSSNDAAADTDNAPVAAYSPSSGLEPVLIENGKVPIPNQDSHERAEDNQSYYPDYYRVAGGE